MAAYSDPSYTRDMSTKLRILLIDKSGRKCLLREIKEILGIEILVAIKYSMKEKIARGLLPASLADGLVLNQTSSVVNWFNIDERTCAIIPILDAIERKEELIILNSATRT